MINGNSDSRFSNCDRYDVYYGDLKEVQVKCGTVFRSTRSVVLYLGVHAVYLQKIHVLVE